MGKVEKVYCRNCGMKGEREYHIVTFTQDDYDNYCHPDGHDWDVIAPKHAPDKVRGLDKPEKGQALGSNLGNESGLS